MLWHSWSNRLKSHKWYMPHGASYKYVSSTHGLVYRWPKLPPGMAWYGSDKSMARWGQADMVGPNKLLSNCLCSSRPVRITDFFLYNLAFFIKISHLYTGRQKTIFRPWTRLCDLRRRGNTSRRHRSPRQGRRSWLAWLATLALTWPEVGVMIHGADLGAVNRGADL